jgi:nucleoid-associated protein YgaU
MEPAMALCAGVAAITLTLGVVGSLPAATRRLAAAHIPLPVKPIAAFLLMTSVAVLPARPRPAAAAVPPPIVRLTDAVDVGGGDAEPPDTEPVFQEATAPGGAAAPTHSVESELRCRAYVVRTGDSLWRIAERTLSDRGNGAVTSADIALFWPVIYGANRALIGDDPNLIFSGQTIQIPEA